jgi:hypothetical protein
VLPVLEDAGTSALLPITGSTKSECGIRRLLSDQTDFFPLPVSSGENISPYNSG